MALTIVTQDLDNYPGTTKNVTIDLTSTVPVGYEGDEQNVISATTTAYSDNDALTAIQDIYLLYFKGGWCKSSGFAGSGGKFALTSTANQMKVKMDSTVSGTDGGGYYTISLAYNVDETPISGESIAEDMETKIRALTMETADIGFSLSYLNASVEYRDGQFWIVSGSMSKYYTGDDKSSVDVLPAASNDCTELLGFTQKMSSEELAGYTVTETTLSSNYTANTTPLSVNTGLGVQAGDACMVYDGVNSDYFIAISGTTDSSIAINTDAYTGINNSYTTTSGAVIQKLRKQDPDGEPTPYYSSIDSIVRWCVKSLANQIDYSS